jgi:hypothetical protein
MNTKGNARPLITLGQDVIERVCVGQIATLAALRAEMTALSTMMSDMSPSAEHTAAAEQPGARAIDFDPEDMVFDNMPV